MPAYLALRDSVSMREALEIEAALCVIGDFREEYSDFRADYKPESPGGVDAFPKATAEDLRSEIAHRETSIERARAKLAGHRAAIAYAASGQPEPEGRLDPAIVATVEQTIAAQTQAVAYLRSKLEQGSAT